ncbi:MAG: response regulator [Candidatus Omnitrophica bacterium]|nr:response regulator [Candidatus Omnitrophota bacterium]
MNAEVKFDYSQSWSPVFDEMDDLVYIVDNNFKIAMVNRAFAEFTAKKKDELIGCACHEVVHSQGRPMDGCPHAKMLVEAKFERSELYDSNIKKWLRVTTTPIFDKNKKIKGSMHMVADITEYKIFEEELVRSKNDLEVQAWGLEKTNRGIKNLYKQLESKNDRLQELNQMRNNFISYITHELRNPLVPLRLGVSELLDGLSGEINDQQKKMLVICEHQIDLMVGLVDNLLDIARMEEGRMKLFMAKVDINNLVKELSDSFALQAKAKGIELGINFLEQTAEVYGDKDKIIEVFDNLIGNAFKFTQKGHVNILLEDDGEYIRSSISDTGRGIAKEDLAKLFNRFQQVGAKTKEKGTGLGLSIVKGIIDLHGGTIEVNSNLDEGSTFTFKLLKYNKDIDEKFRKTILIVDDEDSIRRGIKAILQESGYQNILEADSGEKALEIVAKNCPDAVMLDIKMQGISGYEVIGRLKEDNATKNIPILIMSGYAVDLDEIASVEQKAIPVMSKPFEVEKMKQMVSDLLLNSSF